MHVEKTQLKDQYGNDIALRRMNFGWHNFWPRFHNEDQQKHCMSFFVSTEKCDNKIHIIVKDNGNGIPQKISDKIFQLFFTTKPTGEGTGLGFSLSYDIIKAHAGTLKVESKEGEGSEFMISLPVE